MLYNASFTFGSPLTIPVTAASPMKARNIALERFVSMHPQYGDIVHHMASKLPEKRFMSVSMSAQLFNDKQPMNTCVDTGWHLDGRMNPNDVDHYALICFGDDGTRTLFHRLTLDCETVTSIPKTPAERQALFSSLLAHDLHDESVGFEVPNATPVYYTTFDFHKGRAVKKPASRLFIRVLSSNHIRHAR